MTEQLPSTPNLPESPVPQSPAPESPIPQSPAPRKGRGGLVWGAILISIGVFALIQQLTHLKTDMYLLVFMGFIFLLSGILSRRYGLLIPGGILAGLGVGTLLVEGPFKYLSDQPSSGVFMLAFAAGWLLITLAALLIQRVILWPLIPGAFLGLFGIVLLAGQTGMRALELFGQGWPIILIAIGLYLVLRRRELTK